MMVSSDHDRSSAYKHGEKLLYYADCFYKLIIEELEIICQ